MAEKASNIQDKPERNWEKRLLKSRLKTAVVVIIIIIIIFKAVFF